MNPFSESKNVGVKGEEIWFLKNILSLDIWFILFHTLIKDGRSFFKATSLDV